MAFGLLVWKGFFLCAPRFITFLKFNNIQVQPTNMIEMTKKRVWNKAKIIRADLSEPLDFIEDGSIDVVLSSLTLHYMKNWDIVMSEFNRILKKSGHLVFSVHHPFMDFTVFNKKNYFLTKLINDEWNTNNGKVKVQFYRRPLSKIIASVID